MRFVRRLAAAVAAASVVGALVGVAPASAADTPERFVGSAAGRALDISLLTQDLAFGDATGTLSSALDPASKAAGQLLPELVGATSASANVANPGPVNSGEKCGAPALPSPLGDVLDLGIACSTSTAAVDTAKGLATSASNGYVASLGVDASSILSQLPLDDVLSQVPIDDLADELQTALAPITGPLAEQTGIELDTTIDTVQDLLDELLSVQALEVTLGKATTSVVTEASKLTSIGTAEGATLKVLPLTEALGGVPLATIKVGASKATATYDRSKGEASAQPSASLVSIDLAPALGLPVALSHIDVAPGQTVRILEGTPLQSTITVADGRVENLADGGKKAIADGVSIELLQGLGASSPTAFDGGVAVRLAHSEAAVAGAPAVVTPAPVVAGISVLPRTGGTPWAPIAGIGLLAIALIGRRASVRSARS